MDNQDYFNNINTTIKNYFKILVNVYTIFVFRKIKNTN